MTSQKNGGAEQPRVRGEKEDREEEWSFLVGTTPRVWGKGHSLAEKPAASWEQPRVCGEKTSRPAGL